MSTGADRFLIDFRKKYDPYPVQAKYHASPATKRFLGGAAGPGKTACGIVDHMMECQSFNADDAVHVHTLMLRRTHPKLEATLVTRFQELVPKELYKSFNLSTKVCTWLNGSTTHFGSMQYEHNAWDWQGQWLKIFYDELCEFTFQQWNATSAWNRCPVSKWATKDGAGNPIGIGAGWVRRLFVDKKPCEEMDEQQRKLYNPNEYAYFPCTYLDNPIYANDPTFIANLMNYPEAIRNALMLGSWDVVGGYFEGAFDSSVNVCNASECQPKPWHRRWISGDWGFEHQAAFYWHYMDDFGILRTYKEKVVKHHDPEMLAEMIVRESTDDNGKVSSFQAFAFSHDAFGHKNTATMGANPRSVANRMAEILREYGIPMPVSAGKDKIGREQQMYNQLRRRIKVGTAENGHPIEKPNWIISESCVKLIECLGTAPRDEKKVEEIATFLGDDPLQGAGYGIYHIFGKPAAKPIPVLKQEHWQQNEQLPTQNRIMSQLAFNNKVGHGKKRQTSWR